MSHLVEVARILGNGVPALACRRLAVAAQVEADDAEPLRQRVQVVLEEAARHRDAVDEQHRAAAAAVVVREPDAAADIEKVRHRAIVHPTRVIG
jgi:hypothetical protein